MKAYFKTSTIATSVALALGAATIPLPSQAVSLSDNGLGGTAIVPFYSTRGNDTYISIVNTDPDYAIAVKIRFREADNSRDARDFNIFLSPNDVWTGTVTVGPDAVPRVQTNDATCTSPTLPDLADNPGTKGIPFTAIDYNGGTILGRDAKADADVQIDRTEDGHFEVIEMGAMLPQLAPASNADRNVAGYATKESGYFDCGVVATAMSGAKWNVPVAPMAWSVDNQFNNTANGAGNLPAQCDGVDCGAPPREVMQVAANIINVSAGVAATVPVTTLQLFSDTVIFSPPGDETPNLNSASPPVTNQILDGVPFTSTFIYGVDAVSSLIMATEVLNQYAVGGAGEAQNDWVVTFPTKNFYVDGPLQLADGLNPPVPWSVTTPNNARAPFSNLWVGLDDQGNPVPGNGLSCELVSFGYFNREEQPFVGTENPDFSPTPIGAPGDSLCYETQTLQFGASPVLNGRNNYGVPLADGFTSGWMRLSFNGQNAGVGLSGSGGVQLGLPVLSFGVKSYTNGVTDTRGILNYGFTQPAAFKRVLSIP